MMAEHPQNEVQTDVPRRSALPTANLGSILNQQALLDQPSDQYLDEIEEEWNKKVDVEIETLADGMADLVNLASVSDLRVLHGVYTVIEVDACVLR